VITAVLILLTVVTVVAVLDAADNGGPRSI